MNEKAVINGKEYRFVKTVTDIATDRTAVLCEDEHGCFFICDAELWESSSVKPKAEFNKYVTPDQKIGLFKSLFIMNTGDNHLELSPELFCYSILQQQLQITFSLQKYQFQYLVLLFINYQKQYSS